MEQALEAQREVDAPQKARFWIKRRAERLQSRSPVQKSLSNSSEVDPSICSVKMALPMGILVCLVIVSMGLSVFAIAAEAPMEKESNDMETTIKSRSDYPDYDDLSSFFDFEIGPPSITYQEAEDSSAKKSFHARPNANKNYYYYHSEGYPKYKKPYPVTPKKQVVTPGTHYKSSTEKTFVEDDEKANESKPILNQKIGGYQVSIVDADNPIFSKLGLTPDDLAKLTGYKKIANTSLLASDSTPSATYVENPRPDYQNSGNQSPNSPAYPSYDSSKYPPPEANYGERQQKPEERYSPSESQNTNGDYNRPSPSYHPPPQGSYDAKSYKSLQNGYSQGSSGHNTHPSYYHPQSPSYNNPSPPSYNNPSPPSYNNPSPPSYNNPPPPSSSYNNPPPPHSYNNPPPTTYNNPPPPSYNNHHPAPYNHPTPQSSPSSSTYNPQRSSGEPWRPNTQAHTDWDDKQTKKNSWQSGPYPPHPPPLPYSSTSSSSGGYSKPYYSATAEKTGSRFASSYKPETPSKPSYGSSSSSTEYSSHKPYYHSSTYSSSSKVPARAGTVTVAASHHHPAPAKPGITISFKAKAPSHHHSHSQGHGVSIPISLSPFQVVKKLLPLSSLNPLNNKKVTIGITIEDKKEHHPEYHSY